MPRSTKIKRPLALLPGAPPDVVNALRPLATYEALDDPMDYLARNSGKFIKYLEHAADIAAEKGHIDTATQLVMFLVNKSPISRTKIDVNFNPQMRTETDLSTMDTEALERLALENTDD
jgi:hypothetical protein